MVGPLRADDPREVGSYRLLGRLGGGGMGQVYLGRSRGGRTVAVKLIQAELAANRQFRRRFAQEVSAARKVGGFYTAQVVDADPDADPPWVATDYIRGITLAEAIQVHGRLPVSAVRLLGGGLAEGLAAIHACGLLHRDLKPSNVVLADDGPRVIDFGIAAVLDGSIYEPTAFVGTPSFMSPEQAQERPLGRPSDVFSLGLVLAYAATGTHPFGTGPADAITYRIVHREPDLTGVPPDLTELVSACLAKEPEDRPSLSAMLDHLAPPDTITGWLPPDVTAFVTRQAPISRLPAEIPTSDHFDGRLPDRPTTVTGSVPRNTRSRRLPCVGKRRGPLLAVAAAMAASVAAFFLTADHSPRPIGAWPLDESHGTDDIAGHHDGHSWHVTFTKDQGGMFNTDQGGTVEKDLHSMISVPGQTLNIGASFTVSAWACLTSTDNFATAVSLEGTNKSGFYLQYSKEENRWAINRASRVVSKNPPVPNRWTHLVGVYNKRGELSLYVDGRVQDTMKEPREIPDMSFPYKTNALIIGRAQASGKPADWFPGRIKDVEVFKQALTSSEIRNLYSKGARGAARSCQ